MFCTRKQSLTIIPFQNYVGHPWTLLYIFQQEHMVGYPKSELLKQDLEEKLDHQWVNSALLSDSDAEFFMSQAKL